MINELPHNCHHFHENFNCIVIINSTINDLIIVINLSNDLLSVAHNRYNEGEAQQVVCIYSTKKAHTSWCEIFLSKLGNLKSEGSKKSNQKLLESWKKIRRWLWNFLNERRWTWLLFSVNSKFLLIAQIVEAKFIFFKIKI